MARKPHKYHYIYKTTCNVNGNYYIGMHSCSNLEDGYMGSGKRLRRSLNKYGIENHTKEILEFLDDRESLKKREFEIVNEELIQDPLCMNLVVGGNGGGYVIDEDEWKRKLSISSKLRWSNPEQRKKSSIYLIDKWKSSSEYREKMIERNLGNQYALGNKSFSGRSHSEESKKKISESSKGNGLKENNSQFGTCWITNGTENKKIKKDEQIPDGWELGRKIKK